MNKNTSILHIAECAGGVERYLQMLLPRMKACGFTQYFICSNNYKAELYQGMVDGVTQMDLRQTFSPLQVVKKVAAIRSVIRQKHPDVIYCHSSFAGGLGRLASIGLSCKVVYNPHGWGFMCSKRGKQWVFLLMERLLASFTNKIVCISNAEKEVAREKHIGHEKQFEVIHNGVDIERIKAITPILRSELGIDTNTFVVGMVARITPLKDPMTFIKAAELVSKKIKNAVFIIVGDGEDKEYIKGYARQHNINLLVTGWTDNPHAYTKIFDVGLLLSRWWEGFGFAVAEYMAAGKNVIATRTGGIPELINDNEDALLVAPESPQQVSEKILWLYHHPIEAASMRKKALEKSKKFSIDNVVNKHAKLMENL